MEIKAKFENNNINVTMESQGATGATGAGVAAGGTAGQVLKKVDSTDYNTTWITLTTDLIAEGASNFYHTSARVLAVVLTGLSTASATAITAADTVLTSLGKLQAQITANLSTLTSHTGNTSNPHSVTKSQVGLGNVDNTADNTKAVSSASTLTTARTIDGQSFDGSANITVIAPGTVAATGKTTPVDADVMPLADSAASNVLKKVTWANIKATLKTYFDTLYTETIGTIDSQTKSSNGAVINGTSLVLQNADATYPGLVSVAEQTLAGTKLFSHVGTSGTNASIASSWAPSNYGYKGWVCDPIIASGAGSPTNGTSYVAKIWLPRSGQTITHAYMRVSVAGTSVTQTYCALYLSWGGSLLAQSDNRSSAMGSSNTVTFTFTPQTINQNYVYVMFWTAGGTPAQFNRGAQTGAINDNLGSDPRYATADTGLTTTAPATMGAKSASSLCWWVALD